MTQTKDVASYGGISPSWRKIRRLQPNLFGINRLLDFRRPKDDCCASDIAYIVNHLDEGWHNAAVVINVNPLLIAVYSTDLDCIAMVTFPQCYVIDYHLTPGTRLLALNMYGGDRIVSADLLPGPGNTHEWSRFEPYIAEFMSDDLSLIDKFKQAILAEEWAKTEALGKAYYAKFGNYARDCYPPKICNRPARSLGGKINKIPRDEMPAETVIYNSRSNRDNSESDLSAYRPATIPLSMLKLTQVSPYLRAFNTKLDCLRRDSHSSQYDISYIRKRLLDGCAHAAVVINTKPLLVAAFSPELDSVAMLHFPDVLVVRYNLTRGSQLLSVNTYIMNTKQTHGKVKSDFILSQSRNLNYFNFRAYVADFLTDDLGRLKKRKQEIPSDEWARAEALGKAYFARNGNYARDGDPRFCDWAARKLL